MRIYYRDFISEIFLSEIFFGEDFSGEDLLSRFY